MNLFNQMPTAFIPNTVKELQDYVENAKGAVDPENARRYLNHIFYGDIRQEGIISLPIEIKINLYESLAEEGNERNLEYLDALNKEMGLTEEFYAKQSEDVKTFFGDTKKIEKMWRSFPGTKGTFAAAMHQMINYGEAMNEKDKKQVLIFTSKAYAKHMGIEEPKVEFFEDKPNLHGYFIRETGVIGFNTESSSFKEYPMQAFNTAFHETKHMKQYALAKEYKDGDISRMHKDFISARVFAANLKTKGGYINGGNPLGHDAYASQPSEIGARHSGDTAEIVAKRIYGRLRSRTPEFTRNSIN